MKYMVLLFLFFSEAYLFSHCQYENRTKEKKKKKQQQKKLDVWMRDPKKSEFKCSHLGHWTSSVEAI